MSIANEIEYSERVKPVTKIRLGILSPERIIKQSVAEIYKTVSQTEPLDGTLMDPRLGTNDKNSYNKISDLDYNHDPGNFGHLRLAKPIIQIKFFDQIMQILKIVCFKCSSLLVDKDDEVLMGSIKSKKGKHRFKILKDMKKLADCPNCGMTQPTWSRSKEKNKIYQVSASFTKKGAAQPDEADDRTPEITTEVIYYILKAISDEDAMLIGFDLEMTRPDWMIWTVMPIPPPQMRPTIHLDNGQTSEDDLTSILNDIIKANIALYKALEKNDKKGQDPERDKKRKKDVMERWALLQVYIAAYINNEQSNMETVTNRSSRPLKTIKSRIEAKQGRVRSNLMGKRVDYTARTVITADPNISIDELGVPIKVCKILDYREVVTEQNLTVLHNLVQTGPKVYPGANAIERRNAAGKKVKINLEYGDRTKIRLKPGDIVYRHLMDDDWVKFNRQPSLHKMSMMAHRVRALPHDTFRLNVSVTTPYNADFDGDEMNMHVPRSYRTQVELQELSAVPTQMISPAKSKPVIGLVQDSMLACYRWTSSPDFLNPYQCMTLMAWTSNYNGNLPEPDDPTKGWKAHSIISSILPKFTYQHVDKESPDAHARIVHGKFTEGIWSGDSVGGKISELVHAVWKDFGPETTRHFMDNMMRLTMQWLLMDGFSIGIIDTNITQETKSKVKEIVDKHYKIVNKMISEIRSGTYDVKLSSVPIKEQFERDMFDTLNKVKNDAQSVTYNSLNRNNRIFSTVTAGSKGSKGNVVMMTASCGQQAVDGKNTKRIHNGFNHRTLPHYPKYDMRPESHGFIEGGYMSGLTPVETFMHAVAGREGVISTAIKTGITGYIQRKLIKVLEDLSVRYDGTVRNASDFIVSLMYGSDGFDPTKLEKEYLNYFTMDPNSKKFQNLYLWGGDPEVSKNPKEANEEINKHLTKEAQAQWKIDQAKHFGMKFVEQEYQQIIHDRHILRTVMFPNSCVHGQIYSPVNFNRLLNYVKYTFNLDKLTDSEVTPLEIIQKVNALVQDIQISEDPYVNEECTRQFRFLIHNYLNSKSLITEYHLTRPALDLLILKVKEHYLDSLINPGEMVGCIAAQSIGEPLTQITLDTFHKSGSGAQSKKLNDVPRLREVFSTTTSPKTPFVNIYIQPEVLEISSKDIECSFAETLDEVKQKTEALKNQVQAEAEAKSAKSTKSTTKLAIKSNAKTGDAKTGGAKTDGAKSKSATIPTNDEIIRRAEVVLDQIQFTTMNSLVIGYSIVFDVDEKNSIIEEDRKWLKRAHATMGLDDLETPWLIRFEINPEKIHNLSLPDIKHSIEENVSTEDVRLYVLYTADNSEEIVLRVRVGTRSDDPKADVEEMIKRILTMPVKGLRGIEGGSILQEDRDIITDDGSWISQTSAEYKKIKFVDKEKTQINPLTQQYYIQTDGSNLFDVLAMEGIIQERCYSNSIHEILDVYGIEAAREAIIKEIIDVFAFGGVTLNSRHFRMLADVMTGQGHLVSIDRYGVNKTETGVLSRATFETTTNQIASASVFGEEDNMKGVSANVMFGQFFKGGTNAFGTLLDEELLMENIENGVFKPPREYVKRTMVEYQEDDVHACQDLSFEYTF